MGGRNYVKWLYVYEKTILFMGMNIVFYCICFVLLLSAPNMMTNEFSLNNDTYQKCNFFKNSKFRTEIQKPFRNMSIKQKKTKLNRLIVLSVQYQFLYIRDSFSRIRQLANSDKTIYFCYCEI